MPQGSAPRRTPVWLTGLRYAFIAVVVFAVLFGYQTVSLYTDYLWFGELGRKDVYRTVLGARLQLFFGFGLLFFLVCYYNLWFAQRMNAARPRPLVDIERERFGLAARRATHWATLGGSIFLAFLVGGNAATHWSEYLLFTHAGSFGQADPAFHRDIGFYVFRLPFLGYLQGLLLFTLVVILIATATVHYSDRAIDFLAGSLPTFADYVRRHLLVLLGLFALVYAFGLYLGRYDLLYSDNGQYYGAGYTDLHARLPAIHLQTASMLLVAILCFVNVRYGRAFRLPIGGLIIYGAITIIGTGVLPGLMQRVTVVPNQIDKEREYIERDIKFTRLAYGLANVKEIKEEGTAVLSGADLHKNMATVDNIRLWDWPQLGAVYQTKQAFRNYYRFNLPPNATYTTGDYNIDVDRYRLGNEYRQVMLGARELDPDSLPPQARTWQNQRLQYTHGYGVVMSPVNETDREGLPQYFLSQIPIHADRPGLDITQPQIYYGELTLNYVFADTKQKEFDYPSSGVSGDANIVTRYQGKGGVRLTNTLQRLAWSLRLGDTNMLLSGDLTSDSRILFRRGVRERVQTLAPFLNWDNDPYLVVNGGRLVWIMDAYTVTDRYPYSKLFSAGTGFTDVSQDFNYIRNSVKATVDAYDGTVTLYAADPKDPILSTWSRIFPGLITPMSSMPAGLRAHVRYPEDLFRIQRDLYTVYHMSDAQVYLQKEDQWAVPLDPTPPTDQQGNPISTSGQMRMQPYYVIMRLPGEQDEEFLMMTPYTPLNRDNIAGWMCARSDPEHYGDLVVYRFPKGRTINGPQQIIGQIKQQPEVSQLQTLIGQRGSKVIFGNLLVIPVEGSLLYAVPVYVQAADPGSVPIPQINKVIVATGDQIVMRDSLVQAVAALGGTSAPGVASGPPPPGIATVSPSPGPTPQPGRPSTPSKPATFSELIGRANTAYQRARQKQQEYGTALDDLGRALQELQKMTR